MNKFLRKQADSWTDAAYPLASGYLASRAAAALGGATSGLAVAGGLGAAGVAGSIHGSLAHIPADKRKILQELKELGNSPNMSLVPGIGPSRMARRQRLVTALLKLEGKNEDENHVIHQFASFLNPLNIVAAPIATIGAALTPTRSLKEQSAVVNDPNRTLNTWLIPGYGVYNRWKELGVSNRLDSIEDTIAELESDGYTEEAAAYKRLLKAR